MQKVPFLKLNFNADLNLKINESFARVNDSGHYINGPECSRFEKNFAEYCGAKYCAGISNGLDALFLGLKAIDLKATDAVIVPGNTFIATWLAVSQVGAKLIPVDADINNGQMDPNLLEKALRENSNVKCVILVHLYGIIGDIRRIKELCRKYNVLLMEDAAQAHGSEVDGIKAGAWGDMTAFSFYPGKNLGAIGDAGALVTSNPALFEAVKKLRNYGSSQKYHHDIMGYNHRLDEVQAAILSEKLIFLDSWNKIRAEQVALYQQAFADISSLATFKAAGNFTSWHLFVVLTEKRTELQKFLAEKGIETLIHYPIACHMSGAYKDLGYKENSLPVAERIANTCLSLPIGPHLTNSQIHYVIDQVKAFFGK